jgi:hypothetical protein
MTGPPSSRRGVVATLAAGYFPEAILSRRASPLRSSVPPEVLEPVRRQRRVDGGAGDRPVAEPPWIALVSCPFPQACRSICGCALSSRPAAAAARSIMRAKPAVVNGEPRSLTKIKGDAGLSRWSRRSARSSSPWIGWVLGVPFFTRSSTGGPTTHGADDLACRRTEPSPP